MSGLIFRALPSDLSSNTIPLVLLNNGDVGIGTLSPAQALEVNGRIQVDSLASTSATNLCVSANVISSCSSSVRYKEHIKGASFGLREVEAMRPVTFKWKGRNENDIGLIAEEVAKVNPLFVTYKNGQIEGVKYGQLTAVLINALKELKATNDRQAERLVRLQIDHDIELRQIRARVSALERQVRLRTAQK